MKILAHAAGALLAFACAAGPALAQETIVVNGFGGAADLPVWVAQQKGFFAKEGLRVDYQRTRGSVAQFQDIMAGKFQIAATLLDNVVGYAERQGGVRLEPASDVFAFMGSHEGVNSLVTASAVRDYAGIKGGKVAVDAVATGYAFVLFAMLDKHGLALGRDYQALEVGGPPGRLAALKDGRAVAALMAPPADLAAKEQGYNLPTDTVKEIGPYQAGVYAARRAWADAHPQELVRFTRAMIAAHDYIFADKAGAIEVLRRHFPDMSPRTAESIYAVSIAPGGFQRGGLPSLDGVRTALDLRARYAPVKAALGAPAKYLDLSYYQRALRDD